MATEDEVEDFGGAREPNIPAGGLRSVATPPAILTLGATLSAYEDRGCDAEPRRLLWRRHRDRGFSATRASQEVSTCGVLHCCVEEGL